MAKEYGVTPQGVVIKRLDEILDELHTDLSDGWNVNTLHNPKSFLNVQLTNFADQLTELWEFGEQIYNSMYPFSAEDTSLDNAIQYGGTTREGSRPTYYPMHCECLDGTTIPKGSLIKSNTNPAIQFLSAADTTVTRGACNIARIKIAVVQPGSIYTVVLNGTLYSYTSMSTDDEHDILLGLYNAVTDSSFAVALEDNILVLASYDPKKQETDYQRKNTIVLSGNLTTESVTGLVNYASEQNGEVSLPPGTITQIVTSVTGLLSVTNRLPYIAGRLRQNDVGVRKSYVDKIFARSNRMVESIKSAILQNVPGISGVAGYQNDTEIVDADGRWPHCVEIVVDGGSDFEIAAQIWDKKTDGIHTFGMTEVILPGDEGEPITIRFNRPEYVYVWFRLAITMNPSEILPPNYVEAIQTIIAEAIGSVEPGKSIIPQRLVESRIYSSVPGIAYIETKTAYSVDQHEIPVQYMTGIVPVTARQRAMTDETRIEVILNG